MRTPVGVKEQRSRAIASQFADELAGKGVVDTANPVYYRRVVTARDRPGEPQVLGKTATRGATPRWATPVLSTDTPPPGQHGFPKQR